MKRYRILTYDFDTRARILSMTIEESWEPQVKELWARNKQQIIERLLREYGPSAGDDKIRNFIDFGAMPFSIIAFHNRFFRQVRNAFVVGAYYPALTGACALGERILNHLVLRLREDFKSTPGYKKVHGKESFDNWDLAIDTLESWGVLLPEGVAAYRRLRDLRHRCLHFQPEVDTHDRDLALEAIRQLSGIVEIQFSGVGPRPWIIPGTRGASFVKKSVENIPFVAKVVLPNCHLVGPFHRLEGGPNNWLVHDDHTYEEREITDEEFADLYNTHGSAGAI